MTTLSQALSPRLWISLLALLTLTALLAPSGAMAAEREGTVLFFSFADLKQLLCHPAFPALSARSPSCVWREQYEAAEQEDPLERTYRWGHGLGFEGYAYPGSPPVTVGLLRGCDDYTARFLPQNFRIIRHTAFSSDHSRTMWYITNRYS
jgi:hypothetical protein